MDILEEDTHGGRTVAKEAVEAATDHCYCSPSKAFLLHLPPALVLVAGIWILPRHQGFNLIDHPAQTLGIAGAWQFIFSFLMYTLVSVNQKRCPSVWEAARRSFIILPTGAILAVFVAIIFGAPLDFEQSKKTAYWSQLISALLAVPAGIVLGESWFDWQRLFAFSRPKGALEYSICIPAHGAVIGAWFGAWPMPLDWERPWQEWPVCVTYGMTGGFIMGEILSLVLVLLNARQIRDKQD